MTKADDFVPLHQHSDMSQLDGAGKISDYVKVAKERGTPAIAFTEHGTMRGCYSQLLECREKGIKPIYGVEFYVAIDMNRKGLTDEEKVEIGKGLKRVEAKAATKEYEEKHGIRDRWHLTVWAKNAAGLKNLYKLSSKAYLDGFYYKPRVDLKTLIEHGDGLAVATGCLSSPINDRLCLGKKRAALEKADMLREAFGEDLWLEMQPHAIKDQRVVNKFALKLKERWGAQARLLATQDAHYVHQGDHEAHGVMLCIGTNDRLSNPDRFKFDGDEFFMKTRQQMRDTFKRNHEFIPGHLLKEALDNTLVLNDQIESDIITVDLFKCLMPAPYLPSEHPNEFEYIKSLCLSGWGWRDIPGRAEVVAKHEGIDGQVVLDRYKARLRKELTAIKTQKFVDYFLLVHELYDWVRKQGIFCGPGRGSAAGSLVSFLMGITSVDPIEHGLIFERFISPSRIDMPDIDMDFEDVRRQEIIQHLREKYGEDKVCQIATIGKLSGKQCLKDISRVLEVPYIEVNAVTNSIIERSSGDERASQTIEDSFREFKICRDFNKKYPDVLKYAKKLEGMAKNLGIHAAGVITSPVPLTDLIPLERRNHNGTWVTVSAIDMYGVADMGLLKLDVLGLRTLTVLNDTLKAVKERHGGDLIDLEELKLDDKAVLKGFTDHEYVGIFQYDSPGADKICSGVKFKHFEDIAAMTALNRPGTARSGLATQYVARKKNPKLVKQTAMHPMVSEITKDTLGIIVYQEHVLRIFTEVAGFAPATSDSLRKKIAKKRGDETIGKERQNFIKGAKKTCGMDAKTAGKIMSAIQFFGCLSSDTEIATPTGPKSISSLVRGDEIWSNDSGSVVRNKVHSVWPTGKKKVRRIKTEVGNVEASEDHWWLLPNNTYVRTVELVYGDVLSYPMDFNHVGGEDVVFGGRMRQKGILSHYVQRTLSKGIQEGAHPGWESSGFKSFYGGAGRGEGVEKGEVKARHHIHCFSSNGNIRGEQSSVAGRAYSRFSESKDEFVSRKQQMPEVWGFSTTKSPSTEYESATLPSQKSRQNKQRTAEFGSVVPEVPFQGTLEGKVPGQIRVIAVEFAGERDTWDLECEYEPANYILQNGLGSHNSYGFNKSHATAYGIIAYWCMFCKIYYPLEFYWALLKNEPTRIRIQQFAKDAKKHGIELKPPSVSASRKHFAIDPSDDSIRGSLVDIKGVGEAAATTIMENQPYKGLFDFLERVERRKAHKGVVVALVKAGALDDYIPNIKWLLENIEDFWKKWNRKTGLKECIDMLKSSKNLPDFADEERQLLAASVSPLAFGKHPIDAYENFINKHVKVQIEPMSDEDFFKNHNDKGVYVAGVIVEVKYNQIGDFHTGELPSQEDRDREFWGARYANVNVEDAGGKQNRIKVDIDIFDDFREVVDAGIGTPVVLHATPNKRFENMRAHFLVDLEAYRKRVEAKEPLNLWERILNGDHPTALYPWKQGFTTFKVAGKERKIKNHENRANNVAFFAEVSDRFTGVVTHVKLKYDKNDNLMAFFGMIDANNVYIDAICFGSYWDTALSRVISSGNHVKIQLDRKLQNGHWTYFFNGGAARWFKKSAGFGCVA